MFTFKLIIDKDKILHGNQIVDEWYAMKKRKEVAVSPAMDSILFGNIETVYSSPAVININQLLPVFQNFVDDRYIGSDGHIEQ